MVKYKLIDLQELGVYWDTDATLVGDLPSKDLEVSFVIDTTISIQKLKLIMFQLYYTSLYLEGDQR